ncbi:hypothetical protein COOONC_21347 [Cooperia oncophora]
MVLTFAVLFLLSCSSVTTLSILDQIHRVNEPVPVCDASNSNNSYIYCNGTLLMAVNFHELYNDSKTFVDMPMRYDPGALSVRDRLPATSNLSLHEVKFTRLFNLGSMFAEGLLRN